MKKVQLLFAIAIVSITMFSCKKEENKIKGAIKLDCLINESKTLTNHNDGIDYICDCDVEVRSGVFKIEKGVSIEFTGGGGISIMDNAAIIANGTTDEPIMMQGKSMVAGSWLGLNITSINAQNEISHLQILSAGDRSEAMVAAGFTQTHKSAVWVYGGRLKMSNVLISKSAGNGVTFDASAILSGFSSNTIEQSAAYPTLFYGGQLANTSLSSCTFNANTKNYIAFFSTSSNEIVTESVNFIETPIPYFAHTSAWFEGATTMAAGTRLIMSDNSTLGVSSNGSLRISGTASKPVVLKGETETAGYWKGLLVNTNSANNIFDYLEISDGGGDFLGLMPPKTNIAVADVKTARLTLNNCSSSRSGGCQLAYSSFDATVTNNSTAINDVCTY